MNNDGNQSHDWSNQLPRGEWVAVVAIVVHFGLSVALALGIVLPAFSTLSRVSKTGIGRTTPRCLSIDTGTPKLR